MSNSDNNVSPLVLRDVSRSFVQGDERLDVLKSVNLEIHPGEIIALVGPSGAGKSTLLHIAGLLERPTSGEVIIGGKSCQDLPDNMRTLFRREYLGFVYQYHNLLPEFTALENVVIPQSIGNKDNKKSKEKADWLLDKMGLQDRKHHRPTELSGGEQQRVAIARALANTPRLLLADEPTGNLDPNTSQTVFEELLRLVRDTGLSALVATHNPELASKMDRKIALREGELVELGAKAFMARRNYYKPE